MGHGRLDLALPKATYRLARALRESNAADDQQLQSFLSTMRDLLDMDKAIVNWFRDACGSRFRPSDPNSSRDERDIEKAFAIAPDQCAIELKSVGKLLRKPQVLEQDFVAYLLNAAQTSTGAQPHVTAVPLYRALRGLLLGSTDVLR
jgi:hypothetical protein